MKPAKERPLTQIEERRLIDKALLRRGWAKLTATQRHRGRQTAGVLERQQESRSAAAGRKRP
jgi:hypothetical protein